MLKYNNGATPKLKSILEQSGLGENVQLDVVGDMIVIRSGIVPLDKWDEAIKIAQATGESDEFCWEGFIESDEELSEPYSGSFKGNV